jgi:adenylate cyclase
MRQSLDAWRATGAELPVPYYLDLIAEACGKTGQPDKGLALLDDGLAAAKRSGESWWKAEIYRLKGELRLAESPEAEREAELYFLTAIDVARHQGAKSLELRAAMSRSRLWQREGRSDEARQSLSEVYGWFSDGLATADLRDAKSLLEALG